MDDVPEPPTRLVNMNHLGRALLEYTDPPIQMLFVYNCNPLATMPDQNRVLRGLQRDDLFTVVFDQVITDTARYADVILPSTTFLENYDIARGYGPISLQLVRPVIEPVGESRPNSEVFSDLSARLGLGAVEEEIDTLHARRRPAPAAHRQRTDGARRHHAAVRRRTGAVRGRLSANVGCQGPPVPCLSSTRQAPLGLYGFQPDPATDTLPAGADLTGQREDGLVDARRAARARGGAADAPVGRGGPRPRGRRSGAHLQRSRRGPRARWG